MHRDKEEFILSDWKPEQVAGLKFYYYPMEDPSINNSTMAMGDPFKPRKHTQIHIKHVSTVCLYRDYYGDMLYSKISGKFFEHCVLADFSSMRGTDKYLNATQQLIHWATETLPSDEIVLVPSSGAGSFTYWSNPESAVLAKLLF